ncbi:hypothetical protein [Deinococcus navajonensis]|uniref:Carboxymuconolactone decarboxylase family protein n=1 Tax=Deinococcus navajonensis TaxID=309884 RepID=A0ABV8XH43_9DEIO
MPLDHAGLQLQVEQWKAEGKTPDEAAALVAEQGASAFTIILFLFQVFKVPLRAAQDIAMKALQGDAHSKQTE